VSVERTFKLTLAYDGTAFHGWQKQPGPRTVQDELEAALRTVLGDESVTTAGAGRTDAGVHARGQVASFTHGTRLPAHALAPLLNRQLPPDVRVLVAAEMPAGFHARHSARARRYEYRLLSATDLLHERYAWAPAKLPPLASLAAAVAPLEGRHDFSAFQTVGNAFAEPVCTVHHARWSAREDGAACDILADHFLYHMVRNIIGTALDAAARPDPATHVAAVLAGRDRSRRGRTSPARALSLQRVYYEGEELL
jgi:tRNA pseudouridine38-40 synthase